MKISKPDFAEDFLSPFSFTTMVNRVAQLTFLFCPNLLQISDIFASAKLLHQPHFDQSIDTNSWFGQICCRGLNTILQLGVWFSFSVWYRTGWLYQTANWSQSKWCSKFGFAEDCLFPLTFRFSSRKGGGIEWTFLFCLALLKMSCNILPICLGRWTLLFSDFYFSISCLFKLCKGFLWKGFLTLLYPATVTLDQSIDTEIRFWQNLLQRFEKQMCNRMSDFRFLFDVGMVDNIRLQIEIRSWKFQI